MCDVECLTKVDETFTAKYNDLRRRQIDWTKSSVLIVRGEELVLLYLDESTNERGLDVSLETLGRRTYTFTAPLFHQLKAFCHIPLALMAIVSGGSDDGQVKSDLQRLAGQVHEVQAALRKPDTIRLTEDQEQRNSEILDQTLSFIKRIVSDSTISSPKLEKDVKAYLQKLQPHFASNTLDATTACLESLDKKLRQILSENRQSTVDKRLHVVIQGEHMPADGNMTMQYFLAAKQNVRACDGVYYCSSKLNEEEAITFVAQHLVDGLIGDRVFGEADRMHTDVLADAAASVLNKWKESGRMPLPGLVETGGPKTARRCPFAYR
ncbi:hypothetical protein DFJ77DRAFT_511264 [Powellomyces hirtus]|nr:hypothetical protein DFJ77DRAFT_511264 [Powellomyces hirtus]